MLRRSDQGGDAPAKWNRAVHAGGVWLLTLMVVRVLYQGIERGQLWQTSWSGVVFLISAVGILAGLTGWAGRAAHLGDTAGQRWPLHPAARVYWWRAAVPLAGFAYMGALVAALKAEGVTDPLPYLPLVNPVDLSVAAALMASVVYVWWQRLAAEGCSPEQRRFGAALVFLGASLGLARYYFVLHELWAGMLVALSFGLYRPGRWVPAFCAAALALAIRELTLPFVLLMAVQAVWRWRDGARGAGREAFAWCALVAAFGVGLSVHLHLIAAQTLPSDPLGPSWFAMRGLDGWLSNVILSSDLRFLPHWLAGPVVILMLVGWAGWRSAAGAFGILLYMGYGVAFMIAGRDDNFYWGAMITPALFVGLAFAPMALRSLVRTAVGP